MIRNREMMNVWKSTILIILVVCITCIYSYNPGISIFRKSQLLTRYIVFKNYQSSSADSEIDIQESSTDNDLVDFRTLPDLSSLSETPSAPPFMVPASEVEEDDIDTMMDTDDDPYGDILNMDAPIAKEQNSVMKTQWSIESSTQGTDKSEMKKSLMQSNKPQWEHWDAFMDEQFGDMDREISMYDEDKWVLELRDAVELKRGIAIWSKRSDEEVKREMKKYLAAKASKIPDYIANIVRCVFLEKIMTMKEMREEHELDVINFRKWMIERKKKTKKDPLVSAKLDVSKTWLFQHPRKFEREKITEMPSVVMDELRQSSTSSSMITVSEKDSGAPNVPTAAGGSPSPPSAVKAGSASGSIVTYSMLNWDKDVEDAMNNAWRDRSDVKIEENDIDKFYLDDEEMCVCTDDDYYVVM